MDLTAMDWIRATLCNAVVEGMTVQDLFACAEHAKTIQDFDRAVNELAQMMPRDNI